MRNKKWILKKQESGQKVGSEQSQKQPTKVNHLAGVVMIKHPSKRKVLAAEQAVRERSVKDGCMECHLIEKLLQAKRNHAKTCIYSAVTQLKNERGFCHKNT